MRENPTDAFMRSLPAGKSAKSTTPGSNSRRAAEGGYAFSPRSRAGEHIGARPCGSKRHGYLVVVVVPMTVAPIPILFLVFRGQLAKVSMFIPVVLASPLVVVNDLLVVPDVVVIVVGVIDTVMMFACRAQCRTRQRGRQETGTEKTRLAVHLKWCSFVVDLLS
jgi:hypothetical protein